MTISCVYVGRFYLYLFRVTVRPIELSEIGKFISVQELIICMQVDLPENEILYRYIIDGAEFGKDEYENLSLVLSQFLESGSYLDRRKVIPQDCWTILECISWKITEYESEVTYNTESVNRSFSIPRSKSFEEWVFGQVAFDSADTKESEIRSKFGIKPYILCFYTEKYVTVYYNLEGAELVGEVDSFVLSCLNRTPEELAFRSSNHPDVGRSTDFESDGLQGYITGLREPVAKNLVTSLVLLLVEMGQLSTVDSVNTFSEDVIKAGISESTRNQRNTVETTLNDMVEENKNLNKDDVSVTEEQLMTRIEEENEDIDVDIIEKQFEKLQRRGEIYDAPGKNGYLPSNLGR